MGEYIVYETDERMYFLKTMLQGREAPRTTHVYAPNIVINSLQAEEVGEGEILVAGKALDEAVAILGGKNAEYHNMMLDEVFQAKNAALTAEGALGVIIEHTTLSLSEIKALVIGFGRTGAAVCRLLNRVGVSTDVASTSSVRAAAAFAERVIPASDFDFAPYDVVVNTVPFPIISDKEVLTFAPHAVYIELASKPALSLCFAKYLGLDAEIYPALPAKTSPESAARAILNYVTEVVQ